MRHAGAAFAVRATLLPYFELYIDLFHIAVRAGARRQRWEGGRDGAIDSRTRLIDIERGVPGAQIVRFQGLNAVIWTVE